MSSYVIEFEPVGRRGPCPADADLLTAARSLGVDIASLCGGLGRCKACKIRIVTGQVSDPTSADELTFSDEELAQGWRLACRAFPQSDLKIHVPPESMTSKQRLQVDGRASRIQPDPLVESFSLRLDPPTMTHPRADAENLWSHLPPGRPVRVDPVLLKELSSRLRDCQWRVHAHLFGGELIAVASPGRRRVGLAVDLGSTKIAAYLADLDTGETLASDGAMNPQISYGEDIISRITYAVREPEGRNILQKAVCAAIVGLAGDLCRRTGFATEEILDAVIVGNTAMHHLLAGLPVRQLAAAPYVPAISEAMTVKARELNLPFAPGAHVHLPPNIAGFVGSDHVAALAATLAEAPEGITLILDVGTNTEISLVTPEGISSISCPSGPAFEGYHIKDGVRAARGAIEKIVIDADEVSLETIDHAPAIGICGSGIIDAVAQMALAGVIDKGGRILAGSHPRVSGENGKMEFLLVPAGAGNNKLDISITQKDIREIQLAKSAIQAGVSVILARTGLTVDRIDRVVIAGAFGSYIDIANAVVLGLLPDVPLERYRQVGNAAGVGAAMFLLSSARRNAVRPMLSQVHYVELSGSREFSAQFLKCCDIGPFH